MVDKLVPVKPPACIYCDTRINTESFIEYRLVLKSLPSKAAEKALVALSRTKARLPN
jgi:hypothetical protein